MAARCDGRSVCHRRRLNSPHPKGAKTAWLAHILPEGETRERRTEARLKDMKVLKKLLLLLACVTTIASSAALAVARPQSGDPASTSQSLHAGAVVAAHSLAEIASLVEPPASRTTGGTPLNGARSSGVGRLADSSQAPVPIAGSRDSHFTHAVAQRKSGQDPDGGNVPAVPEPAGWVLLLSGLAVVASIVRRRASMMLM